MTARRVEQIGDATLYLGEALEHLRAMPAASVHAVVTDPPYGLHFMGRAWDHGLPDPAIWAECLRVLKPGGHLVSFGGTRTFHRLWCAAEDAGFEVRDTLCWLYGQGFPKSYNVAQSLQKIADTGNARRPDRDLGGLSRDRFSGSTSGQLIADTGGPVDITNAAAAQWEGWGTALKPGWEPILLARAPFRGTVAANVLAHGTGALNVGACALPITAGGSTARVNTVPMGYGSHPARGPYETGGTEGRWPANVVLDAEAAALLDAQSGELTSGKPGHHQRGVNSGAAYGAESRRPGTPMNGIGDTGGASRFFYCAKAGRGEREAGLEGLAALGKRGLNASPRDYDGMVHKEISVRNHHPTVKPIALMRWLVRMVTPPGGVVLDPFAGSGTTLCAAALEGFAAIGIEREPDFVKIAEARWAHWAQVRLDLDKKPEQMTMGDS